MDKKAHAQRLYDMNCRHVQRHRAELSIRELLQIAKTQDALYLITTGEYTGYMLKRRKGC